MDGVEVLFWTRSLERLRIRSRADRMAMVSSDVAASSAVIYNLAIPPLYSSATSPLEVDHISRLFSFGCIRLIDPFGDSSLVN